MKYRGFTIKKSKIDNKYYAYNQITGNKKNGSSRTFLDNTLKGIKKKINELK